MKRIALLIMLLPFWVGAYHQTHEVTAYTTYENGEITASGKIPKEGMAAADHLPFGTRIVVEGKEYIVEDRFGGGYTDKIDLFFEDYDKAIEFGRRVIVVEILEE